jgi:hypothetical protein
MSLFKNIFSIILCLLIVVSANAEDTCVTCPKKDVEGIPKVPMNGLEKVAMAVGQTEKPILPFESYMDLYCLKYTQISRNELNQMIRDIKETPYNIDDYFLKAKCEPQKAAGVKMTMLQLTAEAPCTRAEYPQIIYKYYTVKRQEPKLWLEVLNSKNTKGETYLDYIELLVQNNEYSTKDGKECISQLVQFACKTGGVYSKIKNKTCPMSI